MRLSHRSVPRSKETYAQKAKKLQLQLQLLVAVAGAKEAIQQSELLCKKQLSYWKTNAYSKSSFEKWLIKIWASQVWLKYKFGRSCYT